MWVRMKRECDAFALYDIKPALAAQYVREGIAEFIHDEDAERMGFSAPVRSELPERAVKQTREKAVRR